ncbi:MAG: tRNA pseudouridine(13) synthase TruD [Gammaproteobacteria bacterium]
MQTFTIPVWPYAYGGPSGRGRVRSVPEDFIVNEKPAFEPSGSGEHAFLSIRKTGQNTEFLARQLARFAGVRQRDIGYAGLKDRNAVTTQWFSVWLPGKEEPDWSKFESDEIQVLRAVRHARKLKRGASCGNDFEITIRDWQGDKDRLDAQLQAIKNGGLPNYFGEQRFGHDGGNIDKALALFKGRRVKHEQRSIYLSAARAFLFNHILARRVADTNWNKAIPGDALALDGSHSFFKYDDGDIGIESRLEALDVHPTGALWGLGTAVIDADALALENKVVAKFPELTEGLLRENLAAERRPLRARVEALQWHFQPDGRLRLSFGLPAGSFATALLREIIET